MNKVLASDVVQAMVDKALTVPPIPYSQEDCYKTIRNAIRDLGGSFTFAGSNDVYRNGCEDIYPLDEAIRERWLAPGWILFIVEEDDKEPAQYQGDGLHNASHMGMYTDRRYLDDDGVEQFIEVVHSSASRGMVCPSTLKNGWTHCGPAKAIEYDHDSGEPETPEVPPTTDVRYGTVVTNESGLNMRETPGGKYMLAIPRGSRIQIMQTKIVSGQNWGQTQWSRGGKTFTGWVSMRYVQLEEPEVTPEQPGDVSEALLKARGYILEAGRIIDGLLGVE